MSQTVPMHNLFGSDNTDDWLDLPATDLEFEQLLAGSTNFEYPDSPTNTDSYFNNDENTHFLPPNPNGNEIKTEIKIEKNELQPQMNNNEYPTDFYKSETKTELPNANQSPFQDINAEMIKKERLNNSQMPLMQQPLTQINPQQIIQQQGNQMSPMNQQQISPQQINPQQINPQMNPQQMTQSQMAGIPPDQLQRVVTSFSLSTRRKNVPVARPPQNQMNMAPVPNQNSQGNNNFMQHSPVHPNTPENSIYYPQNAPQGPPPGNNYLIQNSQPQSRGPQPNGMGIGMQNESFILANRVQGPPQSQNQHPIHQNVSFSPANNQGNLINQNAPQNIPQPQNFGYNTINPQNNSMPPQNAAMMNNPVNHNGHQMDISAPNGQSGNPMSSIATNIPATGSQISTDGRSYPVFPGSTPNNRPITRIQQNSAPILVNPHQNIQGNTLNPQNIQNPINTNVPQPINPNSLHAPTAGHQPIGQNQGGANVPLQNMMQSLPQHQNPPNPSAVVMMQNNMLPQSQGNSRNSNIVPQNTPIQTNNAQIMLNHSGSAQAIPSPSLHYPKNNVPLNSNLPNQAMANTIITGNPTNVPPQQVANYSGRNYHNNPNEISNNNNPISYSRFSVDPNNITNGNIPTSTSNPNIMTPGVVPTVLPPSNPHHPIHEQPSNGNQINMMANRNQPPHSMLSTPSYHQNQQSSCLISHNYQTPYSRAQSSFLYENLTYSSNDSFTTRYQSQTAPAYQSPYFQQNSEMDHLLPNFLHSTPVTQ